MKTNSLHKLTRKERNSICPRGIFSGRSFHKRLLQWRKSWNKAMMTLMRAVLERGLQNILCYWNSGLQFFWWCCLSVSQHNTSPPSPHSLSFGWTLHWNGNKILGVKAVFKWESIATHEQNRWSDRYRGITLQLDESSFKTPQSLMNLQTVSFGVLLQSFIEKCGAFSNSAKVLHESTFANIRECLMASNEKRCKSNDWRKSINQWAVCFEGDFYECKVSN